MGMDTMQSRKFVWLTVPALASLFSGYGQAELTIKPALSSAVYAYGIKDQTSDADRGMAYEIMPSLDLSLKGAWLSTNLNLQSQNLLFDDAQRDNESYFSYNWGSNASFLQNALKLSVGLNHQNRRANSGDNRYQDAISSTDELAAVTGQQAALSYENKRYDWAQIQLGLRVSKSKADEYIANFDQSDSVATDLANSIYGVSFNLQTRDRNRKFFWGLQTDATKTEREVLESQYNRRLQAIVGMPFFWRVSMIATGSVESNSDLAGASSVFAQYRNYHSLGGGLEWKITDRSWWNVTFNKVTDADEDREYIGTEFQLTPSKRTSLRGSIDKRFFGRTAQLEGSYKLQHLRMSVRVSDTVGSVLGLGNDEVESSLFVCPPGVTPGLNNCFQPPTASYIPGQGERFYNIADPSSDLSEFLVVRRDVSYQIGYDFNRLRLMADVGQRKDQLIERNAINDNKFVNLTANWKLSKRDSLALNLNYSDLIYEIDGKQQGSSLAGAMKSVGLSLDRKINKMLSANLNLKRLTVDYRSDDPNYQENRVWVGFNYKF